MKGLTHWFLIMHHIETLSPPILEQCTHSLLLNSSHLYSHSLTLTLKLSEDNKSVALTLTLTSIITFTWFTITFTLTSTNLNALPSLSSCTLSYTTWLASYLTRYTLPLPLPLPPPIAPPLTLLILTLIFTLESSKSQPFPLALANHSHSSHHSTASRSKHSHSHSNSNAWIPRNSYIRSQNSFTRTCCHFKRWIKSRTRTASSVLGRGTSLWRSIFVTLYWIIHLPLPPLPHP